MGCPLRFGDIAVTPSPGNADEIPGRKQAPLLKTTMPESARKCSIASLRRTKLLVKKMNFTGRKVVHPAGKPDFASVDHLAQDWAVFADLLHH